MTNLPDIVERLKTTAREKIAATLREAARPAVLAGKRDHTGQFDTYYVCELEAELTRLSEENRAKDGLISDAQRAVAASNDYIVRLQAYVEAVEGFVITKDGVLWGILAERHQPRGKKAWARFESARQALEEHQSARQALSKQEDRPRAPVDSIGAGYSELEPDDRQKQRNRSPDRQGGEGPGLGGRAALLSGGLQRGQRDVRGEDSGQSVGEQGAGENRSAPTARQALSPNQGGDREQ